MSIKKVWNGPKIAKNVRADVVRFLHAATIAIQNEAKRLLSTAGRGVPSAPGEPPRKQTGYGRASVNRVVDETRLRGRVGTSTRYMAWLERGTTRIAPRPWLRPAAARTRRAVEDLAARMLRKGKGVSGKFGGTDQ